MNGLLKNRGIVINLIYRIPVKMPKRKAWGLKKFAAATRYITTLYKGFVDRVLVYDTADATAQNRRKSLAICVLSL